MGSTLVEKIIARASGRARVSPGEIVTCKVDLAMFHDSSGPRQRETSLRPASVSAGAACGAIQGAWQRSG